MAEKPVGRAYFDVARPSLLVLCVRESELEIIRDKLTVERGIACEVSIAKGLEKAVNRAQVACTCTDAVALIQCGCKWIGAS